MTAPLLTTSSFILHQVDRLYFVLTTGPDMINTHLRQGKEWEPGTLQLARILLEGIEQPVVLDIGANLGAWSVPIGEYIKAAGGRLYAFEPQRQVFYQLCANFLVNRLTNCHANHMAIGDHDGTIDVPVLDVTSEENIGSLSLDPNIRAQQHTLSSVIKDTETVRIARLDTLALPAPNLIKIDVEGLELEVLNGARKWLAQSQFPPLLFEVWGNYMKGLIGKRDRLMNTVHKALGYETETVEELCIAQHPAHKRIAIKRIEGGLEIKKLFAEPQTSPA